MHKSGFILRQLSSRCVITLLKISSFYGLIASLLSVTIHTCTGLLFANDGMIVFSTLCICMPSAIL